MFEILIWKKCSKWKIKLKNFKINENFDKLDAPKSEPPNKC